MAVNKDMQAMLARLKKKIRVLEKKEKQVRNQLQSAIKKIRKLGMVYKHKLAIKMRVMKKEIMEAKHAGYARAVDHIETRLLKAIESKATSVANAVAKIEKKHAAKMTKSLGQRVKKKK